MNSDIRKKSFFEKLKSGLEKTRKLLLTNVDDIILGEKVIDQRLFDELEEALIMADVGPVFTYDLIEKMKEQVKAEIASRKKEEKRGVKSTTIKVQDEKTGEVVEKNISASEMNKRRLEYARQQDAERYKDERTVPLSELQNKKED